MAAPQERADLTIGQTSTPVCAHNVPGRFRQLRSFVSASPDERRNLTVKRFATVLTPMIVLAALAAQAQAQPSSSSLSVATGRAAVKRFADKTALLVEEESSFKRINAEVSACRKHGADVFCLAKWFFPLETCSERLMALPTHRLLVKELSE